MGFFDSNNPDHQKLAQAYSNGTYDQLPPNEVMSHYQSFVQAGPTDEVNKIHQDYFNQMPQVERTGLFSGLMGAMSGQPGFNPNQAGLSTTDPNRASGPDLGNLFNIARSSGLLGGMLGGGQYQQSGGGYSRQQPSSGMGGGLQGLQSLMNNPLASAAISGLISYAASRAFGGGNQQPSYNNQQPNYNNQQPGMNQIPNPNMPPNGTSSW